MGMAHKLHAYATAVGLSLTDDSVLLQFGAVSLGVVEFILGIYLLIGCLLYTSDAADEL